MDKNIQLEISKFVDELISSVISNTLSHTHVLQDISEESEVSDDESLNDTCDEIDSDSDTFEKDDVEVSPSSENSDRIDSEEDTYSDQSEQEESDGSDDAEVTHSSEDLVAEQEVDSEGTDSADSKEEATSVADFNHSEQEDDSDRSDDIEVAPSSEDCKEIVAEKDEESEAHFNEVCADEIVKITKKPGKLSITQKIDPNKDRWNMKSLKHIDFRKNFFQEMNYQLPKINDNLEIPDVCFEINKTINSLLLNDSAEKREELRKTLYNTIDLLEELLSTTELHSEAIYYALYMLGYCKELQNIKRIFLWKIEDIYSLYLTAYYFRPSRFEALYRMLALLYQDGKYMYVVGYGLLVIEEEYPTDDLLVDQKIHQYQLLELVYLSATHINMFLLAYQINIKILSGNTLPDDMYIQKIKNHTLKILHNMKTGTKPTIQNILKKHLFFQQTNISTQTDVATCNTPETSRSKEIQTKKSNKKENKSRKDKPKKKYKKNKKNKPKNCMTNKEIIALRRKRKIT